MVDDGRLKRDFRIGRRADGEAYCQHRPTLEDYIEAAARAERVPIDEYAGALLQVGWDALFGFRKADWLIRLSELPHLLKTTPVRSELVYLLVRLDREYKSSKPNEPWERFYARRLLEHYLPVPAKS